MIKKPEWLIYAGEQREYVGNMKYSKSGKRYYAHALSTYRTACSEMKYEGSYEDWCYLLGLRARR